MTQLNSDMDVKAVICEIGRRMYARSYVAANDGNISIKSDENTIWTTPTGVSKGYMTPDMLVQMDMKGNVLSGTYKPSSEIRMHLRVYEENPEVRAVVHAHPPAATAFAIAGVDLDQAISPEAIVNLGKVAVAPYATPGTQEVPDSIAPYCKNYHAVLLANHGALTWGRDMTEAYFRMESLEHYALMYMYASRLIGHANELSRDQVSELVAIRNRMGVKGGGFPSFRGEREETELLDQLVEKVTARVAAQLQI